MLQLHFLALVDKTGLSTINAFSEILVDKIISIHQDKFGTLVDKNTVYPPTDFLSFSLVLVPSN